MCCSAALGQGWRVGFLGLLHLDVFLQRLEQEHGAPTVTTAPSVPYKVLYFIHNYYNLFVIIFVIIIIIALVIIIVDFIIIIVDFIIIIIIAIVIIIYYYFYNKAKLRWWSPRLGHGAVLPASKSLQISKYC